MKGMMDVIVMEAGRDDDDDGICLCHLDQLFSWIRTSERNRRLIEEEDPQDQRRRKISVIVLQSPHGTARRRIVCLSVCFCCFNRFDVLCFFALL